ncbi:MAG: NlpC/P60 family protein, partial [Defluviitaleaceae bacterium]|nr:NlpC/P60 family protein [Defluviitaleaceae bacterium]
LAPGDLVLFNRGGRIGHVGIYIGGGQYIHSSTYNVGVIISHLHSGSSAQTYVTARRILE